MSDYLIPGDGIYTESTGSYYGAYRTRTFTDIFPGLDVFNDRITNSEICADILDNKHMALVYYLLYGRYGNSHISFSDENQFLYALESTIFMYAPSWIKRLDIQDKLRNLSEKDLLTGGRAIYNHAMNPSTSPSTNTLEELEYINDQNTTNYKKSKMDGYAMLATLLKTDVTEDFINKFKKLFISVVAPDYPLLYTTPDIQL